jgi:hypothetical protein
VCLYRDYRHMTSYMKGLTKLMQIAEHSIPTSAMRLTSVSLVIGLLVTFGAALLVVVGALWAVSYCVVLFLSHTSSVQLVIMLIVAYEAYKVGILIKSKRGKL